YMSTGDRCPLWPKGTALEGQRIKGVRKNEPRHHHLNPADRKEGSMMTDITLSRYTAPETVEL
ncbi:Uncharacterized protein DAT39_005674, partial [Clarias magur]